jgi:hypothetical protein
VTTAFEEILNEVEGRFRNPLAIYAAAKALDNAPNVVGTRALAVKGTQTTDRRSCPARS